MADDEFAQLEAEAEQWLGENPDHGAAALIKQLRATVKRSEKRGYDRATTEFAAKQARAEAYSRLKIPEAVRPLFDGIDPTDAPAVQRQVEALKALGLKLGDDAPEAQAPASPASQQQSQQQVPQVTVDPNLQAVQQMQAAAAGASTSGQEGDLATRMQQMLADPDRYSDADVDKVMREYNQAVGEAALRRTSGALG